MPFPIFRFASKISKYFHSSCSIKLVIIITLIAPISIRCQEQTKFEIPLKKEIGYAVFDPSLSGVSYYNNDSENTNKSTQLKLNGVPTNWTNLKLGEIETNFYQKKYQQYHQGLISEDDFDAAIESWNWNPDSNIYTKQTIKTGVGFAIGSDSSGTVQLVIDANNNLDLTDDVVFTPIYLVRGNNINWDTVKNDSYINIHVERWENNQIRKVEVPLFVAYVSKFGILFKHFKEYSTCEFEGEKIAVNSSGFSNLSYEEPQLLILNDSMDADFELSKDQIIHKNEYFKIKEAYYALKGANPNTNTLIIEKETRPIDEIHSTQIGFKPYPFNGPDITSENSINLDSLKGKYVLLDFWGTWCYPCIKEIPNLKEVYDSTDRDLFEIVGIICESEPEDIQSTIQKHQISWPQIVSTDSNQIRELYNINSYPTTLLIDPNGKIIAKNLRGEKLIETVNNLIR